jgi:hypothetical protein
VEYSQSRTKLKSWSEKYENKNAASPDQETEGLHAEE